MKAAPIQIADGFARFAGALLLPYLLWVGYAGHIEIGLWFLNRVP